jgi:hypothetical protein
MSQRDDPILGQRIRGREGKRDFSVLVRSEPGFPKRQWRKIGPEVFDFRLHGSLEFTRADDETFLVQCGGVHGEGKPFETSMGAHAPWSLWIHRFA